MKIDYRVNRPITARQFVELLIQSSLGERRPINDMACMSGMLANSNLLLTAWDSHQLVGVARSVTDFHYACYLSDLAVHRDYQQKGIGKQLIALTQKQLGGKCSLILLAAPAANEYYRKLGFINNPRCWILPQNVSMEGV
jgi:ribosomal protein S18 acetylase RimI-like enzyme